MVTANKPEVKDNKNTNKNKNKNNKTEVKHNKHKSNKHKSNKHKSNKHKKPDDDKGPLDEKGNPFPMENPEGGDPICQGGYKIDYEFDPINDPINPPFRCISSLKEPTDGLAGKALAMMNNPSSGIQDMAMGNLPGVGGGRRRRSRTTRRSFCRTRRLRRRHRRTRQTMN